MLLEYSNRDAGSESEFVSASAEGGSVDSLAMTPPRNQTLLLLARVGAVLCGAAAAILGVYAVIAVYAGATFEGESLPGPTVLYMVAVAVALGALFCGGLSRILWQWAKRHSAPLTHE